MGRRTSGLKLSAPLRLALLQGGAWTGHRRTNTPPPAFRRGPLKRNEHASHSVTDKQNVKWGVGGGGQRGEGGHSTDQLKTKIKPPD